MPPKRLLPNREIGNSQDSAFSSHRASSAMQDSQQSGFSQTGTQDSSWSYEQQSNNKKMSMYEQWLNRRSLYKRDPLTTDLMDKMPKSAGSSHNHPSNFVQNSITPAVNNDTVLKRPQFDACWSQTDQMNKVRISEQDQRDLLEHVSHVFQRCSQEVKCTLNSVREKFEITADLSNDQLRQTLASFLDDVWKNQDKIESLLQNQERSRISSADLDKKIVERESQIVTLEKQLSEAKGENSERIAENVKSEIQPALNDLQHKLEEILEWTRHTKEWQSKHFDEQKRAMESQWKRYLNLNKLGEKNLKDIERRLQGGLGKIQQTLETKQNELKAEIKDEMMNCLKANSEDMEDIVKQMTQEASSKTRSGGMAQQKAILQEAVKKPFEDMYKKMDNIVSSHVTKRDHQLTSMQNALANSISQLNESLQSEKCQPSCDSDIARQVENKLLTYQSSMVQQLTEMRKHHSKEIMDLKSAFNLNFLHAPFEPRTTELNREKCSSELLSSNQRNVAALRSRSGPSPVATVIPQRQGNNGSNNVVMKTDTKVVSGSQDCASFTVPSRKRKAVYGHIDLSPETTKYAQKDLSLLHWKGASAAQYKMQNSVPVFHGSTSSRSVDKDKSSVVLPISDKQKFLNKSNEHHYQESPRQRKVFQSGSDISTYQHRQHLSLQNNHRDGTQSQNINAILRKRCCQSSDDMTHTYFTKSNRSLVNCSPADRNSKKCDSECSSPTVSITRMTIRRKIKIPSRHPSRDYGQTMRNRTSQVSPARTLLSEISSTF